MSAQAIIDRLGLRPHPEGGFYRQTWADEAEGRPCGTAILFLLTAGQSSHWHRVDATEIWYWHGGAPLVLSVSPDEAGPASDAVLGPDVLGDEMPQLIVPAHHWQAARTTGEWTLVSCSVSPGFRFEGFTLAPEGFDIPRA